MEEGHSSNFIDRNMLSICHFTLEIIIYLITHRFHLPQSHNISMIQFNRNLFIFSIKILIIALADRKQTKIKPKIKSKVSHPSSINAYVYRRRFDDNLSFRLVRQPAKRAARPVRITEFIPCRIFPHKTNFFFLWNKRMPIFWTANGRNSGGPPCL